MRPLTFWTLGSLILTGAPIFAQQADWTSRYAELAANRPGLADSIRLHRLLDLDWEYTNVQYPEFATAVGYPGQNGRWTDNSLEAIARRKQQLQSPLQVIKSINRSALNAEDRLNYDLFLRNTQEAIEGTRFPIEYLAIDQLNGPQYLPDLIQQNPTSTAKDYEDIIARLNALPAVIDQAIVLLGKGVSAKVTPPKITLRDVPDQVAALAAEEGDPLTNPFLVPFTEFPASVPAADQERLRGAAIAALNTRVRPAYLKLHAYLVNTYIPQCTDSIAMTALPNGQAWYAYRVRQQTTTTLTPDQIHQLGLSEVKRIRGQMDSLIAATGFQGTFAEFSQFLRTDPQFYFTDSASLVMAYRDIVKRVDPELIKLFGTLPRLPYGVTTIPSYAAKSQTTAYYQPGSPEAGRAGMYFVNTYDLPSRPKWEMEVLSLHESVPGHHLQIALSQELVGVPAFRRFGGYTAFEEGWALYSESLGYELGMYEDPYSKFGQLTYEMWRAIRLVVDTGIHTKGWTRQQAIDYFKANSSKAEQDIIVEVDRYIVMPAQALGYKLGQLKIKELRANAAAQLGPRFDIRAFHDQVLGAGALPLSLLEARIKAWVEQVRSRG